ncbi:glycine--tRNA ligase [Candidatus Fermentibacteria bacterium]|nr:glycine--tRNA ligase [Candidatus Fermentibacteria bacterium]
MPESSDDLMKKIVSLCKRLGFVYQSGEIYGGLQSAWDYGPLGVELKRNLKNSWWEEMVSHRPDVVGMDSAIITHPEVWVGSGHVEHFHDPMVDCLECKARFRADGLESEVCPNCGGRLTDPRDFGLMLKTHFGAVEDDSAVVYVRPETCQSIFVNFRNVANATRQTLPFGIAQIGKAFRNEITARNFVFRSREFEQMEMEFFCLPEETDRWMEYWAEQRIAWYVSLGMDPDHLRLRAHASDELAHYAVQAVDIEYTFPFAPGGWGEMEGIHNRTDYDLKAQMELSGKDLRYDDKLSNRKILPHVVETSGGVDRTVLALLLDAYHEDEIEGRTRVVLKLSRELAPIKVAVLPLSRKLQDRAREVEKLLRPHWPVFFDVTGSIGKRYRRMDEVGTPFCVTYDFDSIDDGCVTIRERDSLEQIRVPIDDLIEEIDRLMTTGWGRS